MNPSRKPHRKVRTGCRVCKSRKIKCDETKPSCNNCIRHSVPCDIMSTIPATSRSRSPPVEAVTTIPNATTSSLPRFTGDVMHPGLVKLSPLNTLSPMSSHTATPNLQIPLPSMNINPPRNLYLVDMELIHHFATSTCYSLASDPSISTLWRINVPQLGLEHEFVMRGILSLAALHLAHFKPEKRKFYIEQATSHHQYSLPIATSMLHNINEENCTALYIFSSMTMIYAFAFPRKANDFLIVSDTNVSDWVYLLRGIKSIIEMSQNVISQGKFNPMFTVGARRGEVRELSGPYHNFHKLDELQQFIKLSTSSEVDVAAYIDSIEEMRKSFSVMYNFAYSTFELTDIFTWPYTISDHFLMLLKQRTQASLTIYAYFCVLLKRLDSHWWMQGWAVHLISKIYDLLDEEHRLWIRGPIEEIGWVP